jgi:two-component system, OmpR family, phosphate regulon response regulator PhoB
MLALVARTILVVDDETTLRETLAESLVDEGFRVVTAADGRAAIEAFRRSSPDLVLLDLMLPELSGIEVCRAIRAESEVPILMLTARDSELDKVVGLELGADDYVTKPFSPRELLARIQAVLRRTMPGGAGEAIEAGELKIDTAGHRVTVGEQTVPLGPTEYRLLQFFMEHPERVYARGQLLDRVWGGNVYVEERTVDVHIRRLRKALEQFQCDNLVQTVRGAGYRFSTRSE